MRASMGCLGCGYPRWLSDVYSGVGFPGEMTQGFGLCWVVGTDGVVYIACLGLMSVCLRGMRKRKGLVVCIVSLQFSMYQTTSVPYF